MTRLLTHLPPRRASRLPGFRGSSCAERRTRLVESSWLSQKACDHLSKPMTGFDEACADAMVENVIGTHGLPLAVALNFQLNGLDRIVPMAVEEPSVVAACSYAAKLVRDGGGFFADADEPWLTAQIELRSVPQLGNAMVAINAAKEALLAQARSLTPAMVHRGGGAKELEVRVLSADALCVHVHVDTRDAFGANLVSAVAEGLAPRLEQLSGGRAGLKILTNLCDRRKVYLRCTVPAGSLASAEYPDGQLVAAAIAEAQRFAELDVYRATTHNKGVMNGVDAVLVACGNDWRAVEAGAHAWASRNGRYGPLTRWELNADGDLEGELCMPLAASIVGGAARTHPGVTAALELLGATSAVDLAMVAGAAGLASNLAALKALSTEGISKGHMALHARRVAAEVGASGELIELVAAKLSEEKVYRPERAAEVLAALQRSVG